MLIIESDMNPFVAELFIKFFGLVKQILFRFQLSFYAINDQQKFDADN